MNTRKSIALVAAMLITASGMTGIATYSNAAADAARHNMPVAASVGNTAIKTLPTVNVYPTAEQLREVKGIQAQPASASADSRMPFYSFASDTAGA